MQRYLVTGMSCAACSARVEKAVKAVPGVTDCAVSLLTNAMRVSGTARPDDVIRAVERAGYGAALQTAGTRKGDGEDREAEKTLRRLVAGILLLLPLLYLSMGARMWGWPLPPFLAGNPMARGIAQLLFAAAVLAVDRKFFLSGGKGLLHGAPNMDTLVAMGSGISFAWSIYVLVRMSAEQFGAGTEAAAAWEAELYFESSAMILVLITVGKFLEARSKGKTTSALRALTALAPQTATLWRDGEEVTVPVGELRVGDVFAVRPGERIPADGTVLEGETAVDESALTGESIPADKTAGSVVYAATVNCAGYVRCRATGVAEDTAFSGIVRLMEDAQTTKAPMARLADKVSAVFVPAVMGVALVTFAAWCIAGAAIDFALARAISVLVISCPCALGLATPVAIAVGGGVGARRGVLFKTAAALEATGNVQIAVFDKTGTVTTGQPEVTAVLPSSGVSEEELLRAALAAEAKSEHPLARAILREGERRGIPIPDAEGFRALPGNGVCATLDGEEIVGGSAAFLCGRGLADEEAETVAGRIADRGETPLLFARGGKLLGICAVADTVREDCASAMAELRNLGVEPVMLTGDNERTARAVGARAGISRVVAGVMPEEKEAVIRRLSVCGSVAMIGDGINDAPALAAANVGIAIGAGTDVAREAADAVLMKNRVGDVPAAIRLSRAVRRNVAENLFWAFFYNALCIPLAAGCYIAVFGWSLPPMAGAAAMSVSSLFVVGNALRLNRFRMDKPGKESRAGLPPADLDEVLQKIEEDRKEDRKMKKTVKIEGMMCPHCEQHVKAALEALDGVTSAAASHKEGTAVVTMKTAVGDDALKSAVENAGYQVLGIE